MTILPRPHVGAALTFACLLIASPLAAQQAGGDAPAPAGTVTTIAPTGAEPQTETVPAVPQSTATQSTAPQADNPQAGAPEAATGEAAPAATQPTAEQTTAAQTTAEQATDQTAAQPATTEPTATAAPAVAPATETPAPEAPAALPVEIPGAAMLPQSVQDALTPMLQPRDPNLPHDLSPMGMFMAADWVVKAVMIGLALASVLTWTVLVVKLLELAGASRRARSGIRRIETAASLPAALAASGRRSDPVSRMVRAAAGEYERSAPALAEAGDSGVKARVDSHLGRIEAVAGRRMGRGTGVLATIGSTAPFVGLFGTVWGIMNSFIGISEAQTTNLAVVAPGIAEALLATAIGLVAAIPAVVIYNVFARAITGYRMRLADAAAGINRLVSRDLDFRGSQPVAGE